MDRVASDVSSQPIAEFFVRRRASTRKTDVQIEIAEFTRCAPLRVIRRHRLCLVHRRNGRLYFLSDENQSETVSQDDRGQFLHHADLSRKRILQHLKVVPASQPGEMLPTPRVPMKVHRALAGPHALRSAETKGTCCC